MSTKFKYGQIVKIKNSELGFYDGNSGIVLAVSEESWHGTKDGKPKDPPQYYYTVGLAQNFTRSFSEQDLESLGE